MTLASSDCIVVLMTSEIHKINILINHCNINGPSSPHHSAPENVANLATPAKKLEHAIRLAELVIEVLHQNQDHHAEVSLDFFSLFPPCSLSFSLVQNRADLNGQWLLSNNKKGSFAVCTMQFVFVEIRETARVHSPVRSRSLNHFHWIYTLKKAPEYRLFLCSEC